MEFLSLSRRPSSARNVPSGEERGETDVFAGYNVSSINVLNDNTPLPPFLRSHLGHVRVQSFAGQRQYLHFAIIVRPRRLVRPRKASCRLSAFHLSGLTTELLLLRLIKYPLLFFQYQSRPSSTGSSSGKSPRYTSTPRAPVPPSQRPNTAGKSNGTGAQGSRSIGTQTRSVEMLRSQDDYRELKQRPRRRQRERQKTLFFYISFRPSLRDYVVKRPHFTFHGGRKHMATIFSIYLQTQIQPFRIQLLENRQYLTNLDSCNKSDEV